ncbi:hypothetical protein QBC38DRAFT_219475 [Podospora fimiseda]|uniref:Uncharacterized protein n=1 Tax=Podospora fimiseda TaxID=252190 RepID=A0AAN6YKH8_9PEZI|nr:hypothetical protein QBC38DRAFT_219475 [Podospora fimiseda]
MKFPAWVGFTTLILSSLAPLISNTFYLLSVSEISEEINTLRKQKQDELITLSTSILGINLLDIFVGIFLISRRSTTRLPNLVARHPNPLNPVSTLLFTTGPVQPKLS